MGFPKAAAGFYQLQRKITICPGCAEKATAAMPCLRTPFKFFMKFFQLVHPSFIFAAYNRE